MLSPGTGLFIESAGCTCVPTFLLTNFSDLDASCYPQVLHAHVLRLAQSRVVDTRHIVADASRCRFSLHTIPKSFAKLRIPSRS